MFRRAGEWSSRCQLGIFSPSAFAVRFFLLSAFAFRLSTSGRSGRVNWTGAGAKERSAGDDESIGDGGVVLVIENRRHDGEEKMVKLTGGDVFAVVVVFVVCRGGGGGVERTRDGREERRAR